jgi:adenine deaminase
MNDPVDPAIRARAVQAARGSARFDLLLTGGTVVDVATGELRAADIGIVGSMIASVHPPGTREDAEAIHDVSGRFLAPGFIDSHLHYESSFMAPADYAASVVPAGTTTCVWDPHELANVLGLPGVRWAIDASRDLPLRSLIAAPSCVPSAPGLEVAGADVGPAEMAEMLSWPEICGVAEVMDMPGVLRGTAHMTGIVGAGLASGKNVNGHARGMVDGDLQAYASAGVTSCHEIVGPDDFIQKLRTGMTVELRGSHDYVLPGVLTALAALPMLPANLVFCTDDIFPDELLEKGGMRDTIARIIARGMNPIAAIRCATFHAALRLKRDDIGLIGAGRQADIVVLSDITAVTVERVFTAGKLVAKDGKLIEKPRRTPGPTNTVKLAIQPIESFMPKVNGVGDGKARLRKIVGARHGKWGVLETEVRNGFAVLPPDHACITIIHRHGRVPAIPQTCIIEGWGTPRGAIATTISHDSHNLLVLGRDPADMQAAANALIECGGGMSVAREGKVTALVPLPIAGLLAETPPEETAANFARLRAEADMCIDWEGPFRVFRAMTGLSLACNPAPHPTDLGLTDGATGEIFDPAEPLPA